MYRVLDFILSGHSDILPFCFILLVWPFGDIFSKFVVRRLPCIFSIFYGLVQLLLYSLPPVLFTSFFLYKVKLVEMDHKTLTHLT